MALPTMTVTAAGRKIFRDARGKFISESKYNLLSRRNPATGRFVSKEFQRRFGTFQEQQARLIARLGPPPSGMNWVTIANRYIERFQQYLR